MEKVRNVDALEVNVSLEEVFKNDGLLPDTIDLRVSGGVGWEWSRAGLGWGRSGCDAVSQADTSSAVERARLCCLISIAPTAPEAARQWPHIVLPPKNSLFLTCKNAAFVSPLRHKSIPRPFLAPEPRAYPRGRGETTHDRASFDGNVPRTSDESSDSSVNSKLSRKIGFRVYSENWSLSTFNAPLCPFRSRPMRAPLPGQKAPVLVLVTTTKKPKGWFGNRLERELYDECRRYKSVEIIWHASSVLSPLNPPHPFPFSFTVLHFQRAERP